MVMSDELRARIRELAAKKGLGSPTKLAAASGVPRPACSRILSGSAAKKDINTETLEKLARALGCTVQLLEFKPAKKQRRK